MCVDPYDITPHPQLQAPVNTPCVVLVLCRASDVGGPSTQLDFGALASEFRKATFTYIRKTKQQIPGMPAVR